jgi:hypothetical protein
MTPNYQFVGIMSHGLQERLAQLRTSAEFRSIEASLVAKYDSVFVIMAKDVVPFTAWPYQYKEQEVTGFRDRIAYIYIETTTKSVKQEDGIWKAYSAEQIFVHALVHRASNLPPDGGNIFTYHRGRASEVEAIDRTNIITREALLDGPRDTAGPTFKESSDSRYPSFRFQDGSLVVPVQEDIPSFIPKAKDLPFGTMSRIEELRNGDGETDQLIYHRADSSTVTVDLDNDNSKPWSFETIWRDTEGSIDKKTTNYDSGGKVEVDLDQDNSQPWSQQTTHFTATDAVTSIDTRNDDGTRTLALYDVGNAQWYRSYLNSYAADGHLLTHIGTADNGDTWVNSYDALGRVTIGDWHGANGSHWTDVYDPANTQWYRSYTNRYSPLDGHLMVHEGIADNGDQWVNTYDGLKSATSRGRIAGRCVRRDDARPQANHRRVAGRLGDSAHRAQPNAAFFGRKTEQKGANDN